MGYDDSYRNAGIAQGIEKAAQNFQSAMVNMQNLAVAKAKLKQETETFNLDMKIKKLELQKAENDPTQDPTTLALKKEALKAEETTKKASLEYGAKLQGFVAPALFNKLEAAKDDVANIMQEFGAGVDASGRLTITPAKKARTDRGETLNELNDLLENSSVDPQTRNKIKTVLDAHINTTLEEYGIDPASQVNLGGSKPGLIRKGMDFISGRGSAAPAASAGEKEFASMDEAEKANLPSGTVIKVGGKRYKAN